MLRLTRNNIPFDTDGSLALDSEVPNESELQSWFPSTSLGVCWLAARLLAAHPCPASPVSPG